VLKDSLALKDLLGQQVHKGLLDLRDRKDLQEQQEPLEMR
jgi:hypothetical protein